MLFDFKSVLGEYHEQQQWRTFVRTRFFYYYYCSHNDLIFHLALEHFWYVITTICGQSGYLKIFGAFLSWFCWQQFQSNQSQNMKMKMVAFFQGKIFRHREHNTNPWINIQLQHDTLLERLQGQ